MNKSIIVAKREFIRLIRSKWFRVFFLLPLIIVALIYIFLTFTPGGISLFKEKKKTIGLVDRSTEIIHFLKDTENFKFVIADSTQAFDSVMVGSFDGFLIIPENPDSNSSIYYSRTASDISRLRNTLSSAAFKWRLKKRGLSVSLAEKLNRKVDITTKKISEKGSKGSGIELFVFGMFMVVFLYMFIIMASQIMARSAVEEKLNGMIELIISDISPTKLLFGKFLGVTAAVVLLLVAWLVVVMTFMGNALFFINRSIDISIPKGILFYFIGAFIFGYTLYTSIILLSVSAVNSEQEVNNAMGVGVLIILIPYFLSFLLIKDKPDSIVSVVSSLIPFFTPLIMPLRLSISTVPLWQIIGSFVLLFGTAWAFLILAGKVYRISMLMVGEPLRLSRIFQLLRKK